jgi:hypothetical protein
MWIVRKPLIGTFVAVAINLIILTAANATPESASPESGGIIRALQDETRGMVSLLLSKPLVQFLLAILVGSAITGIAVDRLSPWLERRKFVRRRKAALRRQQLRARDDALLGDQELAELNAPVPKLGIHA